MKRTLAAALAAALLVALVVVLTAGGASSTASSGPGNWKDNVRGRCGALVVNARFLATAVLRDQPVRAHNRAVKIRVRARVCGRALRAIPGG